MSYDPTRVAFVDTETTGLDPELDYIWEVAVIVDDVEHVWQQQLPGTDGEPARGGAHWSTFVSDWVKENTRILDAYDHATALTERASSDRFAKLVGSRHLIGACTWFDSERLHRLQIEQSIFRPDVPRLHLWHYHLIDVENLAVGYLRGMREAIGRIQAAGTPVPRETIAVIGYGELPVDQFDETALPWKSEELSRALGVDPADFEPKHSALADARWAKALYERIMGPPRPVSPAVGR